MGKGGAFELNYSSDIDLIVFFDRSRARLAEPSEDVDFFVKLTKRIVRIMSERTADGYVFRTDLRLRPDPGATPIAIPLEAALSYYESMGQNWERAAYHQGAAGRGRHFRRRSSFCRSSRPSSGANISTSPPSPTCIRSSGRFTP